MHVTESLDHGTLDMLRTETTEHPQSELNIHPEVSISDQHSLSFSLKYPFHCPESKEEGQLADEQFTSSAIPCVLAAGSVDEKCQALCSGVYEYFSAKYGTRSKTSRKKKREKYSKQEKALIREERNKARQRLRKAKRNSSDPESIRELARNFHLYLRQYSRLNRAESRNARKIQETQARRECTKNFWKFAAEVFDDGNDRSDV